MTSGQHSPRKNRCALFVCIFESHQTPTIVMLLCMNTSLIEFIKAFIKAYSYTVYTFKIFFNQSNDRSYTYIRNEDV